MAYRLKSKKKQITVGFSKIAADVPKILQKSIQRKLNVKLTRTWQIFPMVSITLLDILGVIRFSWVGLRESTKYKIFFQIKTLCRNVDLMKKRSNLKFNF
jgi:hypothetical protein